MAFRGLIVLALVIVFSLVGVNRLSDKVQPEVFEFLTKDTEKWLATLKEQGVPLNTDAKTASATLGAIELACAILLLTSFTQLAAFVLTCLMGAATYIRVLQNDEANLIYTAAGLAGLSFLALVMSPASAPKSKTA